MKDLLQINTQVGNNANLRLKSQVGPVINDVYQLSEYCFIKANIRKAHTNKLIH